MEKERFDPHCVEGGVRHCPPRPCAAAQIVVWRRVAADNSSRTASNKEAAIGPLDQYCGVNLLQNLPISTVIANQSADWCGNLCAGSIEFAEILDKTDSFTCEIATPACALVRNDTDLYYCI